MYSSVKNIRKSNRWVNIIPWTNFWYLHYFCCKVSSCLLCLLKSTCTFQLTSLVTVISTVESFLKADCAVFGTISIFIRKQINIVIIIIISITILIDIIKRSSWNFQLLAWCNYQRIFRVACFSINIVKMFFR